MNQQSRVTASSNPSYVKTMMALGSTVFLLFSIIFTIFSFASTGSLGGELYSISKKTAQLQEQNRRLTETLAKKQSLSALAQKAIADGYVPIQSLTNVTPQDTKVALDIAR